MLRSTLLVSAVQPLKGNWLHKAASLGSALYIYGVISNVVGGLTSGTNLSFFIDSEHVGQFSHSPDGSGFYKYHVLLYSNTSLQYKKHHFRLQNGHIGGPPSLILLDYIIYSGYVYGLHLIYCGLTTHYST